MVYLDRRLSDQDKRNKLCDLCVFAVIKVCPEVFSHFFIHRKAAEIVNINIIVKDEVFPEGHGCIYLPVSLL